MIEGIFPVTAAAGAVSGLIDRGLCQGNVHIADDRSEASIRNAVLEERLAEAERRVHEAERYSAELKRLLDDFALSQAEACAADRCCQYQTSPLPSASPSSVLRNGSRSCRCGATIMSLLHRLSESDRIIERLRCDIETKNTRIYDLVMGKGTSIGSSVTIQHQVQAAVSENRTKVDLDHHQRDKAPSLAAEFNPDSRLPAPLS